MSKTKKRVLSVLAILFAVALVFTACLALTGCGDDDGDTKTDTTTTGTKLTLASTEDNPLNENFTEGLWVYRYDASYDPSEMAKSYLGRGEGDYYAFVFENGVILFGDEGDYADLTGPNAQSAGTDGTWTYADGTFAVDLGSNTATVEDNTDGTVKVTAVSSNWGTYVATIDPSDFAS